MKIENENIKDIKREILEVLDEVGVSASRIILFGSRARGDSTSQSDWDFLIISGEDVSREEKRKIAHRVRRRLAESYLTCDVIVKSEQEVEERRNSIGSVVKGVMEEGLPI